MLLRKEILPLKVRTHNEVFTWLQPGLQHPQADLANHFVADHVLAWLQITQGGWSQRVLPPRADHLNVRSSPVVCVSKHPWLDDRRWSLWHGESHVKPQWDCGTAMYLCEMGWAAAYVQSRSWWYEPHTQCIRLDKSALPPGCSWCLLILVVKNSTSCGSHPKNSLRKPK